VDGYQQLEQPERWSRGWSGYFHWHLDAFLLSIALERVTIKRFMLARAAAAAVAPRAGGAGSRTATHAWNGRSTAPFAAECQSFLDNG